MIFGGYQRKSADDFSFKLNNQKVYRICKSEPISNYIKRQQIKYFGHLVRKENESILKRLTFDAEKQVKKEKPMSSLKCDVIKSMSIDITQICEEALDRKF